jgi:hypothetical protein
MDRPAVQEALKDLKLLNRGIPEEIPASSDVSDQRSERLLRRLVESENLGLPFVYRVAESPQVELRNEVVIYGV